MNDVPVPASPELPRIPNRAVSVCEFSVGTPGVESENRRIQFAIDHVSKSGGGRVIVPGGVWNTAGIHLRSHVELHLEEGAELRFSQNPQEYLPLVLSQRAGIRIYNYSPFIYAFQCHDVAITGHGILNGQGHTWWPWKFSQPGMKTILVDIPQQRIPLAQRVFGTRRDGVRPVFCQPMECERVLIEGVCFLNSPSWTIHPVACHNVTVRYVTVRNPPSPFSHNTDGIDPDACRNVLIDHCDISTGDDAICLKSGSGPDAWEDGQPCENVVISNCVIGNGHGAITIGSEMSGGVRNVHVRDCIVDGANVGIRIKSKPPRGGFIEDITFERIQMSRILCHAVGCTLLYDGNREEVLNLKNLEHVPRVDRITIRDVECTASASGIKLEGLAGHPLKNLTFENVSVVSSSDIRLCGVQNLSLSGVNIQLDGKDSSNGDGPVLPAGCAVYRVAEAIQGASVDFPGDKRPMAGRSTVAITNDTEGPPLKLLWRSPRECKTPSMLRFTVAVDHRSAQRVQIANLLTGAVYGRMDVIQSCPGQVFELELSQEMTEGALRDGLALSLLGATPPLWIVAPGENAPPPVLPHLLPMQESSGIEGFLSLFTSSATLQPCDWMGICVLDGLADIASIGSFEARHALNHHMTTFFDPVSGRRENMYGQPSDGDGGGPESSGPFAILAILKRTHPSLASAISGFDIYHNPLTDSVGSRVVAETSYNVAYPMMAMAVWAGKDELYQRAIRQLKVNRHYLADADDLYLRHDPKSGQRTFPNWSRGVAWYLLGLIRTLALIPDHERPLCLVEEANRVTAWAGKHQKADGLWPCFLKESATVTDTSGSAGIAAAIAIGAAVNILDADFLPTAMGARAGMMAYLAPDGWLQGASQSNKREAEEYDLQRSDYRVIAPWGMGLFAQLIAATRRNSGAKGEGYEAATIHRD